MSNAKEMRKQARQMNEMARAIEIMEISQKGGPEAVQKHVQKKLRQKMNRKMNALKRKAMNNLFGM